jgi:general secretion pathway protein G
VPRLSVLEVIALVLAIVIVATYVTPESFRPRGDPRATALSDVDALGAALETYRLDSDHFPTTAQGLAALVERPALAPRPWNWRGPYVVRPIPTDPWGHAYVYQLSQRDEGTGSEGYVLSSYGADGRPGGQGDDADVTVRR